MGRALAFHPGVLCLDEPLRSLDEETRGEMGARLKTVQRRVGVTVLHVTHRSGEAVKPADIRLRLEGGQVRAAD